MSPEDSHSRNLWKSKTANAISLWCLHLGQTVRHGGYRETRALGERTQDQILAQLPAGLDLLYVTSSRPRCPHLKMGKGIVPTS